MLVILVALVGPTAAQDAANPLKDGKASANDLAAAYVHWAYQPVIKPAIQPIASNTSSNPIDAFILAKLNEKGLTLSQAADRRTLIRRIFFDLVGLPPTPEQVEAFVNDPSHEAYGTLVDQLLASPAYGERWARHWLDVVHYGESHGFGMDRPRPNAWPYRDYVIRSFNQDKPYARFIEEQIAGDALFPDDPDGVVAVGFVAAGPWNQSPQAEQMDDIACKKIAQNLDRDDMLTTTMVTFTSSTVHCARCHDHKFDPITQREYYNLQSVFAGVDRADRPFDADPKVFQRRRQLVRDQATLASGGLPGGELEPTVADAKIEALRQTAAAATQAWKVLEPSTFTSESGATLKLLADASVLVSGVLPEKDTYTLSIRAELKGITGFRLEVLPDDSLPHKGAGRQPENGNFSLTGFRVFATAAQPTASSAAAAIPVVLKNPTADFSENGGAVGQSLGGDPKFGWSIHPNEGAPHQAVYVLESPLGFEGGTDLSFKLEQQHGRQHLIGRFRISLTTAAPPPAADAVPFSVARLLNVPNETLSGGQRAELVRFALTRELQSELTALGPPSSVYAISNDFAPMRKFKPTHTPRPIFVLKRGDIDQPMEPARPGALACAQGLDPAFAIADLSDEAARRGALARWLSDPRNPLVWRSIVNRVWQFHFGRGIVATANDFGHMGAKPSHPELLDWLAADFIEKGGSLKQLHRLIVTSQTYQQSSTFNEAAAAIDSDNRLLWRMNRTRLDAECVRDAILQITGTLDSTMGGESVKQSVFEDPNVEVTPRADYAAFDVDQPQSRRRSIYRYLFRTLPDPFMDTMDCADASQLTAQRNVSVTALQALAMMNNRFVVRYSEHLAERVAKDVSPSTDRTAQLNRAYILALGRPASAEELAALLPYANKFDLASACRVILNCNEFLFVN